LSDTWVWNGSTWSMPTISNSPSARDGGIVAMVGGKVVLFGGQDLNSAPLGDTWIWDGSDWSPESDLTTSPPARLAASAAVFQGQLVLFGGTTNNGNDLYDTWIWTGTQWFAGPVSGPTPRSFAAMVGPG
ncbi:MAG TPA: hypothetical protein VHS09_05095, partial [Polyangiaceae bacterium]|nr:hypothetical protein [Polyangiaceae bacterium]